MLKVGRRQGGRGCWDGADNAGSAVDVDGNTVNGSVMSFSSYGPGRPSTEDEGQITISPAEITVPVYGAWTFDLTVEGLENEAVTWSITEGIIGGRVRGPVSTMLPAAAGSSTYEPLSLANPAIYGEAEVTLSTDWECPEEPPEPGYELVWARTDCPKFSRAGSMVLPGRREHSGWVDRPTWNTGLIKASIWAGSAAASTDLGRSRKPTPATTPGRAIPMCPLQEATMGNSPTCRESLAMLRAMSMPAASATVACKR